MTRYIKRAFLLLSSLCVLNACSSFLEVDLPKSQLTNATVFDSYETANAALANIYAKIRDAGILSGTGGASSQMGSYADELIVYGNPSGPNMQFYNNALLPTMSAITEYWNNSYNQIYAANTLIAGVENSVSLTSNDKRQFTGEALFLRALVHFYLVNLFGDVPYIKTTDYELNRKVSRLSTNVVYENIIADLKNAQILLPETYSSAERSRVNRHVCKAFLARVYLYGKSYADAENEASAVLNQKALFSLENDLTKTFLIPSKETILQLQSAVSGQNTKEAGIFIFVAGPPASLSLTPNLINSFQTNDLRKANWIKSVTKGLDTWYHAFKYKEQTNTAVSKEYSVLFRLAEQYLIRAEARAQQGNLTGAKEDLNMIRSRAGIGNTTAATKEEILDAILKERRLELFTEHGHRFLDLKRFDKLDSQLSGLKLGWNSTDRLLPIPQNELNANPNLLPQNLGY